MSGPRAPVADWLLRHGFVLIMAGFFLFFALTARSFLTPGNLLDLLEGNAVLLILALAMTLIVASGGIDLSVGVALDFGAAFAMVALKDHGAPGAVAVLAALVGGALVGMVNAGLIVGLRVSPFLATLSVLFIGSSIERIYTEGGGPISFRKMPESYRDLATGKDLADEIPDTRGSLEWSRDGSTLFYIKVDDHQRPLFVYSHKLGTPVSDDKLVYAEQDSGFFVGLSATQSGKFILIDIHDHETSEVHLIDADSPEDPPRLVAARRVIAAEQRRAPDFLGGGENDLEPLGAREQPSKALLLGRETPDAVFHDDDGAIHDQAEVQRAEAHEVAADPVFHHAGDREEHRQRDDECSDERGAEIAQQREQNHDDEHRALEQVFLHGADRGVDEIGAVVKGARHHAFGQGAIDFRHLGVDAFGDGAAVFADEHEYRAEHDFLAVFSRGAGAKFRTQAHIGHVMDVDRLTVAMAHHDVADVLEAADLAGRPNEILFAEAFDVTRAYVRVVAGECGHHIVQRQVVGEQFVRLWRDVELFHVTTNGVDLDDAGQVAQLWFHDPILRSAQIHRGVCAAAGFWYARFRLDSEHVNFAKAGGDWPE